MYKLIEYIRISFQEHQKQLKQRMQELNESDALKDARKKFVGFFFFKNFYLLRLFFSTF